MYEPGTSGGPRVGDALVHVDQLGADLDAPAERAEYLCRVGDEVHEDLPELTRVTVNRGTTADAVRVHFDRGTDERRDHAQRVRDELVEIDVADARRSLPEIREHRATELRGALSGELDILERHRHGARALDLRDRVTRVGEDTGQHVVEVVCDPPDEQADRLFLLATQGLLLQPACLRDVARDRERGHRGIADVDRIELDVQPPPGGLESSLERGLQPGVESRERGAHGRAIGLDEQLVEWSAYELDVAERAEVVHATVREHDLIVRTDLNDPVVGGLDKVTVPFVARHPWGVDAVVRAQRRDEEQCRIPTPRDLVECRCDGSRATPAVEAAVRDRPRHPTGRCREGGDRGEQIGVILGMNERLRRAGRPEVGDRHPGLALERAIHPHGLARRRPHEHEGIDAVGERREGSVDHMHHHPIEYRSSARTRAKGHGGRAD